MLEQWYGAFGHVRIYRPDILSRLRHFCAHLRAEPLFQIGLWAKASNWKSPLERLSVLICCGGGGLVFFIRNNLKKKPLYSTFPPHTPLVFFTAFLTHCGEIHYEAAPFFFILPLWRRVKRDRLSRIDNEQGDWHWGEGEGKRRKKEQKIEGTQVERERRRDDKKRKIEN